MTQYENGDYYDNVTGSVADSNTRSVPIRKRKEKGYVKEGKHHKAYVPTNAEDYF